MVELTADDNVCRCLSVLAHYQHLHLSDKLEDKQTDLLLRFAYLP